MGPDGADGQPFHRFNDGNSPVLSVANFEYQYPDFFDM
jgi:hypothetical protein